MVNIHLYIISLLLISILSLLLSRPISTDAVAADPPPPSSPQPLLFKGTVSRDVYPKSLFGPVYNPFGLLIKTLKHFPI